MGSAGIRYYPGSTSHKHCDFFNRDEGCRLSLYKWPGDEELLVSRV